MRLPRSTDARHAPAAPWIQGALLPTAGGRRRALMATVASGLLVLALASGARADGGAGGSPEGGAGGIDSLTGTGGAGANGTTGQGAGGGGGAGVTGGAGGAGAGGGSAIGGTGGASPGATGGNGSFGTGYGAGAGGGGAHGYVGAAAPSGNVWGGNGGYGGSDGGSNGGGGGAGGYGAVLTGNSYTLTTSFFGGTGGNGGYGNWGETGYGGDAGTAGIGLAFSATDGVVATVSGTVQGGQGGEAGAGSPTGTGGTPGTDSAGGVGISGENLTLILTSTAQVSGGFTWNGTAQSAAVAFTGGTNVLELQPGATISGAVTGADADDTLRFGGPSGIGQSFDLSQLDAGGQFAGFGTLEQAGASGLVIVGSSNAAFTLLVSGGQAELSSGVALSGPVTVSSGGVLVLKGNDLAGPVTLSGTLSSWMSTSTLGSLVLADTGVIDTLLDTAVVVSGSVTGSGTLTKTGAGALTLSSGSSATGLISVAQGAIVLGAGSTVSGAVQVDSAGRLALSGGNTLGGTLTLSGIAIVEGASPNLLSGGLVLSGAGTVLASDGASLLVTGAVSGSGSLTKEGAGGLTLAGGSTASGLIEVAGGTLGLGSGASVTGPLQVDAAGTLALSGGNTLGGTFALAGTVSASGASTIATLVLDGAGTVNTQDGAVLTVTDAVTGSGALTKAGSGGLALTAGSSASGTIDVASGTLALGSGASISGPAQVAASATLALAEASTVAGALGLSGTVAALGDSTLAGTVSVTGTGTVSAVAGAILSVTGAVSGAGTLEKTGAGIVVLENAVNAPGAVAVTQGALVVGLDGSLAAPVSVSTGAVLGLAGGATVSGPVTLGGTVLSEAVVPGAGANTLAGGLILAGTGIVDTRGASELVIENGVSGTGGLVKIGEGTLAITSPSSYTGPTDILAGTLALTGAGSIASSSGVNLSGAGAVLDISGTTAGGAVTTLNGMGTVALGGQTLTVTNGAGVFQGGITGTGGFTLANGTQVLGGTMTYSGPTTVAGGTLVLEGALTASEVLVQSGATLTGSGAMAGLNAGAGATVSPGPGTATLAVTGDATLAPGSTYVADITAGGAQDLIAVGGVATVSGATLQVVAAPGIYLPGDVYPLLVAEGGVEGTFGTVTTNFTSAFLDTSVAYGADGLALDVSRNNRAFVEVAVTRNQQEVAAAVEALGVANEIHDAVLQLSAARAQSAFDLLSGEVYGSAGTVMQQQSVYVRDAVSARLRQADPAPAAQPLGYAAGAPMTATLGAGLTPVLWAQGYGGWGDSYGNGNAASISNSLGGFLMGADVALGASARAGLFAGFSQSQFDVAPRASSGSMDNYDLGAYAGTRFGAFALRGGAAYSWHDVSTVRTISFDYFGGSASADYTTGTTQVFGEVAMDFAAGAFAFEPFAGLAYVNVGSASFLESGSAAALSVDTASIGTTYSTLGLRAATSLVLMGRALTPSVMVGWQHAFGDTDPAATMRFSDGALPFTVSGVPIAEDALLLEAGLAYGLSGVATLSLAYSGQIASEAAQNAFTAQFFLKF